MTGAKGKHQRSPVWDDDYEPTPEELEENVKIDTTPEKLARTVLTYKAPTAE